MDTRAQSGLGGGIFLGVVGAILYFAVTAEISGIDVSVVGAILMIAGALLAGFGLISALTAPQRADGTEVRTYTRQERVDAGHATNYGLLGTIAMVLLVLVLLSILL